MNGIKYLKPEDLEDLNHREIIAYTYFLSSCRNHDGILVSSFDLDKYERAFSGRLALSAYHKLLEGHYIKETSDHKITVGTFLEVGSLYPHSTDTTKESLKLLTSFIDAYKDISARSMSVCEKLKKMLERPANELGTEDFIYYYQLVFQVVFQEQSRVLTGKERGQLKTIVRLYTKQDVLALITEFIVNNEVYCRNTFPSIGLLLYNKDKLHLKIKGLTGSKKHRVRNRHKKSDDSF